MIRPLVVALAITLPGCRQSTEAPVATTSHALSSDAAVGGQDAGALAMLASRELTSLSPDEARTVCEAASDRTDLCLQQGVFGDASPEQCNAQVDACHDAAPRLDCSFAHFDFGADCTAHVEDYLTCVQDYYAHLSCDRKFEPPEVLATCLPLLRSCPTLAAEFGDPENYIESCDQTTAPERVDHDDDIRGLDACPPLPTRMVALGDSIAACLLTTDGACAPALIADYLRDQHAPDLEYSSFAVSGSHTRDWMSQAERVAQGSGHVLVWIYLGGNDLVQCANGPLTGLVSCIDDALVDAMAEWQRLFDYFTDPARFPDGVTFALNTQYSPADACRLMGSLAGGIMLEDSLLKRFNDALFIQPAIARADTVTIDQYPDWLGHGRNANKRGCPYCYKDDNSTWLANDGVHPNGLGQRHIAQKWQIALDAMYGHCGAR